MTEFIMLLLIIVAVVTYFQARKIKEQLANAIKKAQQKENELIQEQEKLQAEIDALARFREIADAENEAAQLRKSAEEVLKAAQKQALETHQKALSDANSMRQNVRIEAEKIRNDANDYAKNRHERIDLLLASANQQAQQILKDANLDAKTKRERIDNLLETASQQANQIIKDANERAEKIAGDAYIALAKANQLESAINAMKNVIEGYGERYLKPTYSLLDELAEAYGFDNAGQQLKQARDRSKLMVEHNRAATCKYVEIHRRETAIRFVLDAFNGKVDSILSRAKVDNFGTLEQQIRDAYALVNNNGSAFRDARINPEYLEARITELKWIVAVYELKEQEKEEQRRIREQIREEEKARREIERALKEAAKEEETLHKAMEKARLQIEQATEEQRTIFEAKLSELQLKLAEAEARNQRAQSMAQQTKAGHVYVISNIGSFGDDVFKVGMTRRLEPLDRVRELGDASVPFSFDVHAMIWCEDAPALETLLHKHFVEAQVNKVNPRKEFFRLPLTHLRQVIEEQGIEASWTMSAKALEFRESQAIEQGLRDNAIVKANWLKHQELISLEDSAELVGVS
jgi:hypothetical protein